MAEKYANSGGQLLDVLAISIRRNQRAGGMTVEVRRGTSHSGEQRSRNREGLTAVTGFALVESKLLPTLGALSGDEALDADMYENGAVGKHDGMGLIIFADFSRHVGNVRKIFKGTLGIFHPAFEMGQTASCLPSKHRTDVQEASVGENGRAVGAGNRNLYGFTEGLSAVFADHVEGAEIALLGSRGIHRIQMFCNQGVELRIVLIFLVINLSLKSNRIVKAGQQHAVTRDSNTGITVIKRRIDKGLSLGPRFTLVGTVRDHGLSEGTNVLHAVAGSNHSKAPIGELGNGRPRKIIKTAFLVVADHSYIGNDFDFFLRDQHGRYLVFCKYVFEKILYVLQNKFAHPKRHAQFFSKRLTKSSSVRPSSGMNCLQ